MPLFGSFLGVKNEDKVAFTKGVRANLLVIGGFGMLHHDLFVVAM